MIGVFDSGIGGLTVVRALMAALPAHDIVYLGDTARTPYGSKSAQTIINYSLNNAAFLIQQGAQILVIACNTASSFAFGALKAHLKLPVFEVIGPGARLAVKQSRKGRIGVIGTRATVASGIYQQSIRQLDPRTTVYAQACPLLVPLVEECWLSKPETSLIVRKYLQPLRMKQIDTLIMGCTHYPVLREIIQRKIGRRVTLVDSAEAVAAQVRDYFGSVAAAATGTPAPRYRFFVTDTAEQFRKTARLILKHEYPILQADL